MVRIVEVLPHMTLDVATTVVASLRRAIVGKRRGVVGQSEHLLIHILTAHVLILSITVSALPHSSASRCARLLSV